MKASQRHTIRRLAAQLRQILDGTGTTAKIVRANGQERVEIQEATSLNARRFPPYGNPQWEDAYNRIVEFDPGWKFPGISVEMKKG